MASRILINNNNTIIIHLQFVASQILMIPKRERHDGHRGNNMTVMGAGGGVCAQHDGHRGNNMTWR